MKKTSQTLASTDQQEKPKVRVPFFAQKLNRETLRTISGGDSPEKTPAQEATSKTP